MFNKWTKFNKGLMWFSIVAWLIVVIALTCVMASGYGTRNIAWVVAVGGTLVVFASHALWGLVIEMSQNLIIMSAKSISGGQGEKQNTSAQTANHVLSNMLNANGNWICDICGKENQRGSKFCQGCGHSKDETGDRS